MFGFAACLVSIGVMAVAALLSNQPLIFPSLGPTAFLIFERPYAPVAAPRNVLAGHLVGVCAGYLCLAIFGLRDAPSALASGVTADRVGAAALSMAITAAVMILARVVHPPAGATTLIVSLGLLTSPSQVGALMGAVVVFTALAVAIDRLVGLSIPLWGQSVDESGPGTPPGSWGG